MSLKPTPIQPVPEETARVARAAFPKGNPYLILRDQLGVIFHDSDFADLYPATGQHSLTPSKRTLTSWWPGRCLLAIAFLAAVVEVMAAECPPELKPSCARNENAVCVRDHRGETTRSYWKCEAVSSTQPPREDVVVPKPKDSVKFSEGVLIALIGAAATVLAAIIAFRRRRTRHDDT